jgi:hypothetical protein
MARAAINCPQQPPTAAYTTSTGQVARWAQPMFAQVNATSGDAARIIGTGHPLSRTFGAKTGGFSSFSPVWCTNCPRWIVKMINRKHEKAR